MDKTQRAAFSVACPTCKAKVGEACKPPVSGAMLGWVHHVERYRKANRLGSTAKRGAPR